MKFLNTYSYKLMNRGLREPRRKVIWILSSISFIISNDEIFTKGIKDIGEK